MREVEMEGEQQRVEKKADGQLQLAGWLQAGQPGVFMDKGAVDDKFIASYDGAVLVQGLWEGKNQNVTTVWSLLL